MGVLKRIAHFLFPHQHSVLDDLPAMHKPWPCRKCGSTQYTRWHQFEGTHWLKPDPRECDRCTEIPNPLDELPEEDGGARG